MVAFPVCMLTVPPWIADDLTRLSCHAKAAQGSLTAEAHTTSGIPCCCRQAFQDSNNIGTCSCMRPALAITTCLNCRHHLCLMEGCRSCHCFSLHSKCHSWYVFLLLHSLATGWHQNCKFHDRRVAGGGTPPAQYHRDYCSAQGKSYAIAFKIVTIHGVASISMQFDPQADEICGFKFFWQKLVYRQINTFSFITFRGHLHSLFGFDIHDPDINIVECMKLQHLFPGNPSVIQFFASLGAGFLPAT